MTIVNIERRAAPRDSASITQLLNQADSARDALDEVIPLVYQELKRIAHGVLAQSRHQTLSATVLVHEVYAKIVGSEQILVSGRQHFYSLCARVMRQIVIDYARAQLAGKRGSGQPREILATDGLIDASRPESLVALDAALTTLAARDERLAMILQYRIFAGLELGEIAEICGVTPRQIQREWRRALIWIADCMIDDV